MKKITVGEIDISLERKKIKNIHLKIRAHTGAVYISAPYHVSEEFIKEFALSKIDWMRNRISTAKVRQEISTQYMSGEHVAVWGKNYTLIVLAAKRGGVSLHGDNLYLRVKNPDTFAAREKVLLSWYRKQLEAEVPARLTRLEEVAGVTASCWQIKKMRTKWGTCNIREKKIWINLYLAQKPIECLDYLILHELCHLLERGHNKRFYSYMDRFMPDWRQKRAVLNGKIHNTAGGIYEDQDGAGKRL